jgi:ribosomal protein S12 methylthiotransferase
MYLHPARVTGELIHTIATEPKIVKYLDLPIQHASDKILSLMLRRVSRAQIESLINKIRREIPKVALRTTLIVGFPGETEADFTELASFVKKFKFERLGVFKYSREKGTPAAKLKQAVPDRVKQKRFDEVMSLQRRISRSRNQNWVFGTLLYGRPGN